MKPSEINAAIRAALAEESPLVKQRETLEQEAKGIKEKQPQPQPDDLTADEKKRLAEIESAKKAASVTLAPIQAKLEDLRAQKSAIINAYGAKIRAIRDSKKLNAQQFVEWRRSMQAEPSEDARMVLIDAKLAEVTQ